MITHTHPARALALCAALALTGAAVTWGFLRWWAPLEVEWCEGRR